MEYREEGSSFNVTFGTKNEVNVGGTSDYNQLKNQPKINGVELRGDKTAEQIGVQPKGDYALKSEIPTKVSELENDIGFITTEADPTVPTYIKTITQNDINNWNSKTYFSGDYNDLTNKPTIPSTEGFATVEQLTQGLASKQDTLVSGISIKTINNQSLLGIGDIVIEGGGGAPITVDTEMSDTSENPVQNKVIKAYVDGLTGNVEAILQTLNSGSGV